MKYRIWSNKRKAWWNAGGLGYTLNKSEAGQFELIEALQICRQSNADPDYKNTFRSAMVPVEE